MVRASELPVLQIIENIQKSSDDEMKYGVLGRSREMLKKIIIRNHKIMNDEKDAAMTGPISKGIAVNGL